MCNGCTTFDYNSVLRVPNFTCSERVKTKIQWNLSWAKSTGTAPIFSSWQLFLNIGFENSWTINKAPSLDKNILYLHQWCDVQKSSTSIKSGIWLLTNYYCLFVYLPFKLLWFFKINDFYKLLLKTNFTCLVIFTHRAHVSFYRFFFRRV